MRHVKNKNDYNDQELTYITAVLRHVLNQLDKQDESFKEKFINNVRFRKCNPDFRFDKLEIDIKTFRFKQVAIMEFNVFAYLEV